MALIFISSENNCISLEAETRDELISKIKGWYGFMKLTGHNIKHEEDAFIVFAKPKNGEKYRLGTVSVLPKKMNW